MKATPTPTRIKDTAEWPPSRKEARKEIEQAFAGAFRKFLESALTGDAGRETGVTSRATGPLVTEDFLDKLQAEAYPIPHPENSTPRVAAKFRRSGTAIDFDAS
jgi:hypothetical protein